eukprot:scaffold39.g4412.t1
MVHAGLSSFLEDAYDATMWLLVGVLQIALLVGVVGPLQRWRPVESLTDRAQLDQIWPGVTDRPLISLVIYLLAFDAFDYFYHRAQHRYRWLWCLHAVHHSQRQMTMWSDNRNHLLDDVLHDSLVVVLSQIIGVPPGQFVAIVAITQLVQSFAHANLRLSFGAVGERLLVSPRFHRRHHSIRYDASTPGPARGYNFAVLFPIWDVLCRTARIDARYEPTGIHDQLLQAGGRDYGRGFWAQQWLAFKRWGERNSGQPVSAVSASVRDGG